MLNEYHNVLVTGGLGFIGRHLVKALLHSGKSVAIVDHHGRTSYDTTVPEGATVVQADIRHPEQLARVVKDVDLIFHAAANSNGSLSVENPRFDFETNAVGTFNILEAASQAKVKRFVYVSSASVYGKPQYTPMDELHPTRPFVPYGASKLMGELSAFSFYHAQGLPIAIARPFCVYGPGENPRHALVEVSRYVRWHLNHQPIQVIGDARKKTRDFVHVSDLVQGLLLIADRAELGETFNIGSGDEFSMLDLARVIGTVTAREATLNEIASVTQDTYRLVANIEKIKALGYVPHVSIEEGVRQLVEQLGDNPELPGGSTIFAKGQVAE
jgi:nucleoside-diphosphate-sugar epimerase